MATRLPTKSHALPPGPRVAPLQTALYMRDPIGYTRRARERYGDLVTLPVMNGLLVLSMTSEGAREMLSTPADHFGESFGAAALSPILGEGSLMLLSGARHGAERKLLSPTFHGNRMRSLAPTIRAAAEERMSRWQDGQPARLLDEMQAISLDVIIRAALGVHEPERRDRFRVAIGKAVNDANPVLFFFRGLQRPFGGFGPWARFLQNRDTLRQLLAEEIESARQQPADERPDILARLAHAKREDSRPFTDTEIRDHLLTLLVAGYETTANALAWTFYELNRHPEVCDWLLGEIAGTGDASETLARLPALEATAREGLRLHPIIAEFFRPVRKPTPFQGFTVPAGAVLAASVLEIHRDESLYPEPETFRPSRFLERRFAPHEFAAFGGGHRHCLGSAFALSEMCIVLGTVLPRYRFEPASSKPLGIQRRNVTLAPEGGAPVVVRRR